MLCYYDIYIMVQFSVHFNIYIEKVFLFFDYLLLQYVRLYNIKAFTKNE